MFDLLAKVTGAFGVSGNEEEIRNTIIEEIKDKVDEIKTDTLGNLFAIKKGRGKKIMVAAHMDEIGIMVIHIDEKGFIRFTNIGGVSSFTSIGQRVRFKNGVIGVVSYEEKLDDIKKLDLSKMYIDIGAKNREETGKLVKIGDTACFCGDAVRQGDFAISKAMDDRCGCAVAIGAIKNLSQTDNEIYFVFTVQEELGLRGATTAAYQIMPDFAIALDVTGTGDKPESRLMEVKLGAGPAIKIRDRSLICHPEVRKLLEDAAKRNNIPYQYEILEWGGTDAGAIQLTGGGIPSGVISVPCRYIHTPSEMICMSDYENAVKLLVEAIR
ncbi:MAG: M42 family metallopeptidase [Clostridiaceae bacterium]|nr:M42 family metallopeptidase [Clostridiaceae bacterium]